MFARVISGHTAREGFDNIVRFAQEQLPGTRSQPGFKGFYLLTDRGSGGLLTISLWDTREDIEALEAHAAQLNKKAAESVEGAPAPTPAKVYEVEMSHLE